MAAEAFAPAKINLTLHVTGQRADGYHLLDSLVVFADVGDQVRAEPAKRLSLVIDGPMAAGLGAGEDNLVLRAARFMGVDRASLRLTKHLPVASGIGGGSSDAAAAIRALCALTGAALPPAATTAPLGADVPVCLTLRPQRLQGIGEQVTPVTGLPPVWLVLVNPGVQVATPAVFAALARKDGAPMRDPLPGPWPDAKALAHFLAQMRNDLEAPAAAIAPVITTVLAEIGADPDCLLARMSGSGATCFGLYATEDPARAAARRLTAAAPSWWVAAAPILSAA